MAGQTNVVQDTTRGHRYFVFGKGVDAGNTPLILPSVSEEWVTEILRHGGGEKMFSVEKVKVR